MHLASSLGHRGLLRNDLVPTKPCKNPRPCTNTTATLCLQASGQVQLAQVKAATSAGTTQSFHATRLADRVTLQSVPLGSWCRNAAVPQARKDFLHRVRASCYVRVSAQSVAIWFLP